VRLVGFLLLGKLGAKLLGLLLVACAVGLDGGIHAGKLGGVLGFCRLGGLFRHGEAFAELGQLYSLRLAGGLHLGEFVFQRLGLSLVSKSSTVCDASASSRSACSRCSPADRTTS